MYNFLIKVAPMAQNPPTPPGVERVRFRGMTFILQPHPFILQPLLSIHPAIHLAIHASHPKLPAATWCHPSSHPCTPYYRQHPGQLTTSQPARPASLPASQEHGIVHCLLVGPAAALLYPLALWPADHQPASQPGQPACQPARSMG